MKTIFTLTFALLICHLTFAQKGSLFKINSPLPSDLMAQSESTLKGKNLSSDLGIIDISAFNDYIRNNGEEFEQLLFTFNVKNKNKLYFTVRAANRNTGEVADIAFSSLNSKMNIDLDDKQNFNDRKDSAFNPKGFFLDKNEVVAMLKEMGTDMKRIKIKAVHTKDDAQQSFINLLFQSNATTDSITTFSTFNVEAGRMAPETGCPPFNCLNEN